MKVALSRVIMMSICTTDVEQMNAGELSLQQYSTFLWPYESNGRPYFFWLPCPSHWEVTQSAWWQLLQRMKAQSGVTLGSYY